MSDRSTGARRVFGVLARMPATWATVAVILACGLIWRGLWEPFTESPAFDVVAYGVPAFAEGRWWTALTGVFFVSEPWVYVPTLAGLAGLAVLEWLRGWRVALLYFWAGHLFAVFSTALIFSFASVAPGWRWAQEQANTLDVGASAGAFACMAAVAGLLRSTWRVRLWVVLLATALIGLLFLGTVADVEHMAALLFVLLADRSLHVQRTTVREQRLIAFVAMLAFAVIDVIVALVPTDGPFGASEPLSGSPWSTLVDVAVIALIANGLRRARRWAWVVAVVLLTANVILAALLLALLALDPAGMEAAAGSDFTIDIATGFLALATLAYLVHVRAAFRWRRKGGLGRAPAPTADEVKTVIRAEGGGTLSWMTTWEGSRYARTSTGIVAYQRHAGVAIALGDPLGADPARSAAEFVELAEQAGLTPCFFSATDRIRAAVPPGWRSLVVADDTLVDLPGLAFTGKRWNSIRTSVNRAAREQMTFRLTTWAGESWGVRTQLEAISARWVGGKGLPEMGFTLGSLQEAQDPEVRLALAVSPSGDVDGFLSWLPVYGPGDTIRGWTLDLMRRRDDGFAPVMEYLIAQSAAQFRDEGAAFASLSGAPLAHAYPPEADLISTLSERLAGILEPVYGFRSLHRFKEKFRPRYEPLLLLYRDEADLPRIGVGLTRAFLPDASMRQLAGAGRELTLHTGQGHPPGA